MAAKVKGPRATKLDELIDAIISNRPLHPEADPSTLDPVVRGDYEASRGNLVAAIQAYGKAPKPLSATTRAKLGFCLVIEHGAGELKAASELLTSKNVGTHPVARAALVRVLTRRRGFAAQKEDQELAARIMEELLADPEPRPYVFSTALEAGHALRLPASRLDITRRGLELYPDWEFGALRLLHLLRLEQMFEQEALERVLPLIPALDDPTELSDVFAYAFDLRHVSGMDAVLARLETLPRADEVAPDTLASQLEVLRSARDLVAGYQGDAQALEAALARLQRAESSPLTQAWELAKLRLQIALATGRDEAIHAAAAWLLKVAYSGRVPLWISGFDAIEVDVDGLAWGAFRIHSLGIDLRSQRARIISLFDDFENEELETLFNLDAAMHVEEPGESVFEDLASSARHFLPERLLSTAATALLNAEEPNYEAIGSLTVKLAAAHEAAVAAGDQERAQGLLDDLRYGLVESLMGDGLPEIAAGIHLQLVEEPEATRGAKLLTLIGPKLHEHRQAHALNLIAQEVEDRTGSAESMFYLALAADMAGKSELAVERFERAIERDRDNTAAMWNLVQQYARRGNARGLAQISKRLRALANIDPSNEVLSSWADRAEQMRERAAAGYIPPPEDPVDRELSQFPAVGSLQCTPDDLTLAEAVVLIALLRSGEIDHVSWTLPPLQKASVPFESRKRLVGTLFSLASKGLIGFDASTPRGAFDMKDGALSVYLHQVVWKVAPSTLQLEREIRQLPREEWPQAWTATARRLAIDLGTDDVIAYFQHRLEEVGLPAPRENEVREIVSVQLERLSIANVYYLAHKSARSTLEHKAKYNPGEAQLMGRARNLLKENGERMQAEGWDTAFRRNKNAPPASLVYEALIDVLTGWGERAFNQPIDGLSFP